MDLTNTGTMVDVIAGIAVALGVVGVVIPIVPGLLLGWAGVLFWALFSDASGALKWLVLVFATLVAVLGALVKYLVPGKRLKAAGVPNSALLAGGVLGLILGFVLGVWLVERARVGAAQAWPSTKRALAAAGLAMLIEFTAALGVAVVWVFGLLAT